MAPIVQQHKVRRAFVEVAPRGAASAPPRNERTACANREQRKRDFNDEHVVVVVDGIHVPVSRTLD
jgi:hypothetical protein